MLVQVIFIKRRFYVGMNMEIVLKGNRSDDKFNLINWVIEHKGIRDFVDIHIDEDFSFTVDDLELTETPQISLFLDDIFRGKPVWSNELEARYALREMQNRIEKASYDKIQMIATIHDKEYLLGQETLTFPDAWGALKMKAWANDIPKVKKTLEAIGV